MTIGLIRLLFALFGLAAAQDNGASMDMNQTFKELANGYYDRVDEFIARDAEAVPLLLSKLNSKKIQVRSTAIDLLVRIDLLRDAVLDRPDVIGGLGAVVADEEEEDEVIDEALRGLEHLAPGRADAPLVEALFARLDQGFARAAKVIGAVADAAALQRLQPHRSSDDPSVAHWSTLAAARLGDAAAQAIVIARLGEEGRIRNDALLDLVYVRSPKTVRAIAAYLDHPGVPVSSDADVRHMPYRYVAAFALGRIVADGPGTPDDPALIHESDVTAWRDWWKQNSNRFP